jgi:hypothetical protein
VPLRKSWPRGNSAQSMVTASEVVPSVKEHLRSKRTMGAVQLPGKGILLKKKSKTEPLSTSP